MIVAGRITFMHETGYGSMNNSWVKAKIRLQIINISRADRRLFV